MTTARSQVLPSIVLMFALAILFPALGHACSCGSSCSGSYCYCACLICQDTEAKQYPCPAQVLSFNASQEELSQFRSQVDAWSTVEDFHDVVTAANQIYNSVLLKDSAGYAAANTKLQEAIKALPEKARLNLSLWSESKAADK